TSLILYHITVISLLGVGRPAVRPRGGGGGFRRAGDSSAAALPYVSRCRAADASKSWSPGLPIPLLSSPPCPSPLPPSPLFSLLFSLILFSEGFTFTLCTDHCQGDVETQCCRFGNRYPPQTPPRMLRAVCLCHVTHC